MGATALMGASALASGLGSALSGSQGTGGSMNSSQSVSNSFGHGQSVSDSWSRTYGSEATAKSYQEAINATQRQKELMREAEYYNKTEAQLQRDWQEQMANTIYTRSVKNMIEAGINPILAYSMGLSGASVGSGATASISTPSAFMGQTFADQASASHAESSWETGSESHSNSSGSGWNNSESGLATGLAQLGKAFENGLNALSSAKLFDITIGGNTVSEVADKVRQGVEDAYDRVVDNTKDNIKYTYQHWKSQKSTSSGGGHKFYPETGNTAKKASGNTR